METQKDAYKDYCPFKEGYLGFHVSLGECTSAARSLQCAGYGLPARMMPGAWRFGCRRGVGRRGRGPDPGFRVLGLGWFRGGFGLGIRV